MKDDRLKDTDEILNYINNALRFIKRAKLLRRGYVCGAVNALRLIKYKITGEAMIFERNDSQPKEKRKRIENKESLLEDLNEHLEK